MTTNPEVQLQTSTSGIAKSKPKGKYRDFKKKFTFKLILISIVNKQDGTRNIDLHTFISVYLIWFNYVDSEHFCLLIKKNSFPGSDETLYPVRCDAIKKEGKHSSFCAQFVNKSFQSADKSNRNIEISYFAPLLVSKFSCTFSYTYR